MIWQFLIDVFAFAWNWLQDFLSSLPFISDVVNMANSLTIRLPDMPKTYGVVTSSIGIYFVIKNFDILRGAIRKWLI